MKLFLDDIRDAPDGTKVSDFWDTWKVIRTYETMIDHLTRGKNIEVISLDHDLGAEQTGYDVAKWIEEKVATDCNYFPPMIYVHSANPVGRRNILACVNSIGGILEARYDKFLSAWLYQGANLNSEA